MEQGIINHVLNKIESVAPITHGAREELERVFDAFSYTKVHEEAARVALNAGKTEISKEHIDEAYSNIYQTAVYPLTRAQLPES